LTIEVARQPEFMAAVQHAVAEKAWAEQLVNQTYRSLRHRTQFN